MYRRTLGMLGMAISLMLEEDPNQGIQLYNEIKHANRVKANHGTPSGAARAKRITRKRKNIRARATK